MRSNIKNYLIVLSLLPSFLFGQNSQDVPTTTPKSGQTAKGIISVSGLPFEEKNADENLEDSENLPKILAEPSIASATLQTEKRMKEETPTRELQTILEEDLQEVNRELSQIGLAYRKERLLRVKQEEIKFDLSFLGRLENIKQSISHGTTGNAEAFIIAADQFLDTLYNVETNVSEKFKDLSQERYDNYLVKDKILQLQINDVKVEKIKGRNSEEKIYKYSGFALLQNFPKKVRVEFYSNHFVRKADQHLIYEVAKEDNIERTVTVEGVVEEFSHGRIQSTKTDLGDSPMSIVLLKEWIIMEREELVEDFKKK